MDSKLTLYTKPFHFQLIHFHFYILVIAKMQGLVDNNHNR